MQRHWGAMARGALRAGNKAVARAIKKTVKARSPTATPLSNWHAGIAMGSSGTRRYHLYLPDGAQRARDLPLVVMLHGCNQDGRSFAHSTRMNRLAAAEGFVVMYPEQDRMANAHGCWNWFETHSGRAQREAASIVSAIDQVCATHPIDTSRVMVAGMSAGASMAAVLALHYPTHFAAVAMHSGVGPGLAESTTTAIAAMRGRGASGRQHLDPPLTQLPALLVIHGNIDPLVAPSNGHLAAQRWAEMVHAKVDTPRNVQRGARYPVSITDWKVGKRVIATLHKVLGLGHAWSGGPASQPYCDAAGPDASRMVWAFAQRAFAHKRERHRLPV